jgi:adenine-specific DNA methylase
MLNLIHDFHIRTFAESKEAQDLADVYIEAGIIPARFKMDGVHIAITAINNIDCIVSLNFHHINKLKTKTATEVIHKIQGFIL